MIRSMDTLQKSFQLLQKRQETISSNVANNNTTGYQAKKLFQNTLEEVELHNYQRGPENSLRHDIGGFTYGNQISGSYLNEERGAFTPTNRLTDFAVQAEGYFTVQMPDGQMAYTRNGNFTVNNNNQYVTQEGYAVLGANNQPAMAGTQNFLITAFADGQALESQGNAYYTSQVAGQVQANAGVRQGYLEASNVQIADEMVDLIQAAREFEMNQKALSTMNQTLQKTVNEIGR